VILTTLSSVGPKCKGKTVFITLLSCPQRSVKGSWQFSNGRSRVMPGTHPCSSETKRLSGVKFSCWCVHISWWIGDRRSHVTHSNSKNYYFTGKEKLCERLDSFLAIQVVCGLIFSDKGENGWLQKHCLLIFCCRSMTPPPELSLALLLAVGCRQCKFPVETHFTLHYLAC